MISCPERRSEKTFARRTLLIKDCWYLYVESIISAVKLEERRRRRKGWLQRVGVSERRSRNIARRFALVIALPQDRSIG